MSKNNTAESEELTDAMYYILLALMKERHGYEICRRTDARTSSDWAGNTLYLVKEAGENRVDQTIRRK